MRAISIAAALSGVLALAVAASGADAPAAGMGRLYIKRVESDPVPFASPLAIDRKGANGPAHGVCVYFDLPAGSHSVHAMSEKDATVDLAAGDMKYVELRATEKEIGGGYMDQINPSVVDAFDTSACVAGTMR